ncbi:hypothetical protein GCM10010287_46010 [Streptomyces variabilis]|uniref:Uncharacterized protein n=1 Tax=Streptomyces variabilis TaxID=67372 RepID=A0ABQ2U2L3_9ACTN|nr:hypothetical protein GCM10010265_53910 [Streptomyces griseoincarnatus]GGT66396.1 hypothetical protein GCM10010287_46010 [Streptomyces variabilis]
MGERQSDGGRAGRRRVRPERSVCPVGVPAAAGRAAPVSVEGPAGDTARLEALLVAALVRDGVDAGAEQRAVAAFVAAREAGAHGARTRRRDDWRASRRRFGGRSLRATLGALVAGCALSGVAWAGIQAAGTPGGGRSEDTGPTRTPSASSAPAVPDVSGTSGAGEAPGVSASASAAESARDGARHGSGPAEAAGDVEAQCRAYERAAGRGRAPDAPVWERLVAAAGGAARVDAYCAGRAGGALPTASAPAPASVPPVARGEAGAGRPTGEAAGTGSSGEGKGRGEGEGAGRKP